MALLLTLPSKEASQMGHEGVGTSGLTEWVHLGLHLYTGGCYVQASMELGPEDVSLLERCPHFRGCYVQASMDLGPEDVSLLERCPHFRG